MALSGKELGVREQQEKASACDRLSRWDRAGEGVREVGGGQTYAGVGPRKQGGFYLASNRRPVKGFKLGSDIIQLEFFTGLLWLPCGAWISHRNRE